MIFQGVLSPCPPSGSADEYAQLMLDPYHKFLSTTFRRAK